MPGPKIACRNRRCAYVQLRFVRDFSAPTDYARDRRGCSDCGEAARPPSSPARVADDLKDDAPCADVARVTRKLTDREVLLQAAVRMRMDFNNRELADRLERIASRRTFASRAKPK